MSTDLVIVYSTVHFCKQRRFSEAAPKWQPIEDLQMLHASTARTPSPSPSTGSQGWDFASWAEEFEFDQETTAVLIAQKYTSRSALKGMSSADLRDLGLANGQQSALKHALTELGSAHFLPPQQQPSLLPDQQQRLPHRSRGGSRHNLQSELQQPLRVTSELIAA